MQALILSHFKLFAAILVFLTPLGLWLGGTALVQLYKHRGLLRLNQKGLQWQRWGMWDNAVAEYNRALEIVPGDSVSRYNLGFALYFGKGLWHAALEEFGRSISDNPGMAEAFYARGHLRFHCQHDPEAARADLLTALRLDDRLAEAHNTLGMIAIEKSDWAEAISEFRKATEKRDSYALAYANLGIAYINRGEHYEAITALEKCASIDSGKAIHFANLGNAYGACRSFAQSAEAFRKAIALDESNWATHFWLGCVLFQMDRFREAVPVFHRSLSLHGDFGLAHYNLALCFESLKEKDLARKHMDRAIELDPEIGKDLIKG